MREKIKALWSRVHMPLGEFLRYMLVGCGTTVVSWVSYSVCVKWCSLPIDVSNAISWVFAVTFSYVGNRLFVFQDKAHGAGNIFREAFRYYMSRGITGLIELFGVPFLLWIGVDSAPFGVKGLTAKVLVTILVIIGNYVFCKLLVFRKKKEEEKEAENREKPSL